MPGDLLIDTGHPAGLRMIERGAFGDPASPKTAVLIECGQHWEKSAADVAVDTLFRFLAATGAVNASICKSHTRLAPPAVQRLIRVTEPVVAKSMDFRFPYLFKGLEVIPKAGTVVATDGDTRLENALRRLRHGDAVARAREAGNDRAAPGQVRLAIPLVWMTASDPEPSLSA